MKLKTLSSVQGFSGLAKRVGSAFVLALLSSTTITQPSTAEDKTFFCGTSNGVPATIAHTARGEVPMILWNSANIAAGDTPQKRCQEVSSKLQAAYNNGTLKYISTQLKDNQLIACLVQTEDGSCSEPLFPINKAKEPQTPADALQNIFRIRVASSTTINETQMPAYLSLDNYLKGKYCTLEEYKEAISSQDKKRCNINNTRPQTGHVGDE